MSWVRAGGAWASHHWPWLATHWPHVLLVTALVASVGVLAVGAVRYRVKPGSLFVHPARRRARATAVKWAELLLRGFVLFPVAVLTVAAVSLIALVLFLLARVGRHEAD